MCSDFIDPFNLDFLSVADDSVVIFFRSSSNQDILCVAPALVSSQEPVKARVESVFRDDEILSASVFIDSLTATILDPQVEL